jgi:hypothetical protein
MRREDSAIIPIGIHTHRILALFCLGLLLGCSQYTQFYDGEVSEHQTAIIGFSSNEVEAIDGRHISNTRRPGRVLPGTHEVLIRFARSRTVEPGETVSGEGDCRVEFVAEAGRAYRVYTDWEKSDLFRDDEGRPCASEVEGLDDFSEDFPESSGELHEDDCESYKWAPIRRLGVVQDTGDAAQVGRCFIGG